MPATDPDTLRAKTRRKNQRRADRRNEMIRAAKDVPCTDCGIRYPYYVMELDHREPAEKLFQLSRANSYGFAAIEAEIAKCDPVCANCHRVRTFTQEHYNLGK